MIRYVKKLKAFNLLDPTVALQRRRLPTSNQYNFDKGGCPEQPAVVAQNNQPSCTEPPEQSEPNKKQKTISDIDFFAENPQTPHSDPAYIPQMPTRAHRETTNLSPSSL